MKTIIQKMIDSTDFSDDLELRVDQAVKSFMEEIEDLLVSEQVHPTSSFDYSYEDNDDSYHEMVVEEQLLN